MEPFSNIKIALNIKIKKQSYKDFKPAHKIIKNLKDFISN